MNAKTQITAMSTTERIAAAKLKLPRIVDHLLYLLELHENNAIISYSPLLASQIPTSHAANAFIVFQQGLHQFEIVRLCALWDSLDLDKENVPTVVELVDSPDVIETLARETEAHWGGFGGAILNPSTDPVVAEIESQAIQNSERQFGLEQGDKARLGLREAVTTSRAVLASTKHDSIMNLRDKRLAHSLSQTRLEKKAGPVPPMKYGDERNLLDQTLPIVEALYCWVNGTSLSFKDSQEIDRRNAKALWERCTFDVKY